MIGKRVMVWHPDSPGVRLVVYRPWYRRKRRPFATLTEAITVSRWRQGDDFSINAVEEAPWPRW